MKTTITQKIALVLFGLFMGVLLLEAGLRIGGYVFLSRQEHANRRSLQMGDAYVILCLGESTTAFGGEYSYPRQLERILNEKDNGTEFIVINKGLGGTNSGAIVAGLEKNINLYQPDMLVTMMGINDGKDTLVFEENRGSGAGLFLRGFRVYKLARLLLEHVNYFFREMPVARLLEKTPANSVARTEAVDRKGKRTRIEAEKIDLNDGGTYLEWGDWYFKQDRFEAALTLYEETIRFNPSNSEAWIQAAACFRELGKKEEFDRMVDKALEITPEYFRVCLELGNWHRGRNEWEKAEEMYMKAAELSPFQAETYIEWGMVHQAQQKTIEAEAMYRKAISLNPGDYLAHAKLGDLYRKNMRYEEAEREYKKAIEIEPGEVWLYTELKVCYEENGKLNQAEKIRDRERFYKKAIELFPINSWLYAELAAMYKKQGQREDANALLEKLKGVYQKKVEANPDAWWLYAEMGSCCSQLGSWEEAEESYKKALEIKPGVVWLYLELGNCYRSQCKFEEAEMTFRKAIDLEPVNPTLYVELGNCYQDQERHEEAKVAYQKVMEMGFISPSVLVRIAFYLESRGEGELAEEFFDRAEAYRTRFYERVTSRNYRKLKEIVTNRGIKLVCVQYPVLDVDPLKKIFPDERGIIFVDNEKAFKEAVRREGYDEYFADWIGGCFGHGTPKGNRLLAENIADTILKEADE